MHWHIDYLRGVADDAEAFPIVSVRRLECDLARDLAKIADGDVPGFGCSDCSCRSHLHRFGEDPRRVPAFVRVLLRYRHVVSLES
jgi:sugar fermentation stimulation protein A